MTDFDFALQGDAKLSIGIFTANILAIFVAYFYSFTVYQGMQSRERWIQIKNEQLINLSYFIALVAFICLLNSEDYREDKLQK